ncbi:sodium/calcium exchanger 2-like [Gigantopelta aegis]|uniref:sodium/calcium exchanger 2-like n=1 Tax=Gigantopelta aegis TaxID=1735272 RepID=UPI001B88B770|nr:sodium/calcium exchanger 2-like [Gigantopelta aegis]
MTSNATCDLTAYTCSDVGLLMPFVNEYTWPVGVRTGIYLFGLLWSFMAVSIVADVFMRAIETITSKTRTLRISNPKSATGYNEIEIKVWNDTVANLTLMALGSSAPEILLSCIEIVGNTFRAGELGPSTIVGSAAFNLLCITGVCIFMIPDGEKRTVKYVKVFAVTSIFCIFAYVWLIVILVLITPDYVDLWEAVITFLLFPVLILVAYIADKDYCGKKPEDESGAVGFDTDPNRASQSLVIELIKKLSKDPFVNEEDEAKLAAALISQKASHNRGWYRVNAIRNLTGGNRLEPHVNTHQRELLEKILAGEEIDTGSTASLLPPENYALSLVEWDAAAVAILESAKRVKLTLMRTGNMANRFLVRVETINGTAEAGSDYKPIKDTLVFEPNQSLKSIEVEIIDDNEWELDEVFFVKLSVTPDQPAKVGKREICQVTILNDDDPGTFGFSQPSFVFKESAGKAMIPVERKQGADGRASVFWQTKDMTAISSMDYQGGSGELMFQNGEIKKYIEIEIIDDKEFEKDENFEIKIEKVSEGAKIGLAKSVVTILNDDEFKGVVSRVVNLANANLDALRLDSATWGQQFEEAMNVNGGDLETATVFDYIMHFLTFGWKVIFAMIPPPSIWGGWLCFFVALIMIGLLTAIVGDLASVFGCLIDFKKTVTAITFVALGTSLPDLFASKQAAVQEKYADNSIGNVTGSNSVNVFLGLGLPWVIAAIYWGAKGKTFEVPAGSLSFSVILYIVCSLLGLGLLVLRRRLRFFGNAELGGPKGPKIFSALFMISLWIFYVILSSLQAYGHISVSM